jgi:curved DNA-binding protein CbpA
MASHVGIEEKDLYAVLHLKDSGPHVTHTMIRKAYIKRALEIHPDKIRNDYIDATKEFQELQEAYEILNDKETRALYDESQQVKKEKEQKVRARHKMTKKGSSDEDED